MKRGKWTWIGLSLLLVIGWDILRSEALAQDIGWMQQGVRLWYFGGGEGADPGVSNAEETHLLGAIADGKIKVTHHKGSEYWSSTFPVETGSYPLQDQGPCWIHPAVLQNLKAGDFWMEQEITLVTHETDTYETFPYHMLPAWALFRLKPQRELVKLSYKIPKFSDGNAYFDAETGILLYYHTLWGDNKDNKIFFILSEINFDFATGNAFAEDDGPHTGFMSFVSEQSLGNFPISGGGSVVIHSLVETRYGNTVEMTVLTSLSGPSGPPIPLAIENFCFFGDIPQVRYKDAVQASRLRPENWDPYGEYLWWWIPPGALGGSAINVRNVPMSRNVSVSSRLGTAPSTFSATASPPLFYFSNLMFGGDGYLIQFSAKDPRIGLDVRPEDDYFPNSTAVQGLDYYRTTLGKAIPVNYDRLLYLPLILR